MTKTLMKENILNTIVPISRFNKGEANKIFEEVRATGEKVVVKNNKPACVLISPDKYEEMVEIMEDYALFLEAKERLEEENDGQTVSMEAVMKQFGITQDNLDEVEVELEE